MTKTSSKVTGYILIFLAVLIAATVLYKNSKKPPQVFSAKNVIEAVWRKYKINYLENGTYRTIDKQQGNITTSEGQAYTMLRAVWMDDHETFDQSWKWTKDNLQKQGYLFSWLFGERKNGTYGIINERNGQNTASDADTDIAMALMFAYARWRDPIYLEDARNVITDIWNKEVIIIDGKPYMASGNVEKLFTGAIAINPSYLSPAAYRMFSEIDKSHDWMGVVDTSYSVITESMKNNLGLQKSANLPPDWVFIDRSTADIISPSQVNSNLSTNFSYDALRVPWRIALDWKWYKEQKAKNVLSSFGFLSNEWKQGKIIFSEYKHDGSQIQPTSETPAMYGGTIGAFMVMNPEQARDIYENKLLELYSSDSNSWRQVLGYYDDNLAWFGIALYNNQLPNLWATVDQ